MGKKGKNERGDDEAKEERGLESESERRREAEGSQRCCHIWHAGAIASGAVPKGFVSEVSRCLETEAA